MAENYYLNHTATQIDAILTKVDGIAAGANVNVQVDWNQTTTTADDYIKNKPTIPDAQIQSDWNQTDTESKDFIKNKPTIPAAQVNSDWEASSGVAQILNKPTLGTAAAKDYTTAVLSLSNDLVTSSAVSTAISTKADLVDGKVPISQIPPAVIERMVVVADDGARFHLTKSEVQNGDTVKVLDTKRMYLVVDDDHLDTEAGYSVYVAGRAAEAVADEDGNNIKTTYATKAMTKTAWMGTEAAYEALTSDDYDLYVIDEGVVSP